MKDYTSHTEAINRANVAKTPGELAYERDVQETPNYRNGQPRASWEDIGDIARQSWELNPSTFGEEKALREMFREAVTQADANNHVKL